MAEKDVTGGFKNPVAYRVGGVYGGIFMYVGIALPFWSLWLADIGMSPGEIGFLIGFPSFLKVLSSPFVAQICDKTGMVRRPMMVLLALSALFFCGYFFVRSFALLIVVTLLFSVTYYAVGPLLESYAVRVCDRYNLQYGRIRSVGSIVFVLTSIFFGKYLDHTGYDYFLYFCVGSLMITFFAVLQLPREGGQNVRAAESGDSDHAPLKFLLTNRRFIMFLIVVSLIQMSHGFIYVMGSVHWAAQGIDNETIGMLWSIGVIAEIAVFIFGGRIIILFRPMYVLAFIAFFGVVRWWVLGMTAYLPLLFIVQTFHGLTYAASHLVAMYFLSSRVPDQYFMTAQSLYSSVPMGLSIGTVMLVAGPLYNHFGGQAYFFMAALCAVVLVMARFVRRIEPGKLT